MNLTDIFGSFTTVWVIIPLLILLARILDVSIGTVRIILIGKGYTKIAPALGFIESFVWIIAVSQIMQNLNNIYYYVAYAGGFALGTYLGMIIEEKLSLGYVIIRVITHKDATQLVASFREKNYPLTILDAEGINGKVSVLFLVIQRNLTESIINFIKEYNPNAFYSIEDVRFVSGGVMPHLADPSIRKNRWHLFSKRK
ncbi:MAG: hypothetical protein CVV22_01660 [Ignavibacteriae bacterium HGW-Ignavibacteriae-1]|jgi:uncharacterized protein YebE (UPF0316 family)|nr:MAG: hypothetical protein CVV22_01660 [Ignavibacteriae bacterium HGW-Ignavibacteriae-1]